MATLKKKGLSALFISGLTSCCSLLVMLPLTMASAEENTDADESAIDEEIITVGSQVRGANIEGTLPVSVLDQDDIQLTGASSGDELLRSIPQVGEVGFNEAVTTGVNAARGDVNSINLRGLGTGNTLVLLNGRRMVLHPGTQTENFIPVVTNNSNTLPVNGLERIEVLRDGAAALYGSDAVAGVINYILKDDYEGSNISVRYGSSLGTALDEITINGAKGFDFNDGATNLSITGTYYTKNGFGTDERDYSRNSDIRGLFADDPLFADDTSLDNRSSIHGWGAFDFDSGINRLHVRPTDLVRDNGSTYDADDCTYVMGNICLDGGSGDRALRANINPLRMLSSDSERINLFGFLNHELESGTEWYTELGFYSAEVNREREQAGLLSNSRFEVPADYYWNPLGPVKFADGRVNPNRIVPAGDANIPDEGVSFRMRTFRPLDVGPRRVNVEDSSFRFVTGLRGSWGEWDWDTGIIYSEAETIDSTDNRVSHTAFQRSLMLDTQDAYNLFNGLDVNDPTNAIDPTPNPESVLDTLRINVKRESKATLKLVDFKFSNSSIFSLPAGDIGMAAGIEWREEGFTENRDDRSDGTIKFTDLITGNLQNVSDIVGSSASPDASGTRRVTSIYAEFLIPLLNDMPFVDSLEMQLAGRYENFSDVGSVAKPKLALSWRVNDIIQLRTAYSEGFRAPNLIQIHQGVLSVVNSRTDPVTGNRVGLEERRIGNADLKPEEDTNFTYGLVFTPLDDLTITADYWQIEQDGVVGIMGSRNALELDFVLRSMGSFNPNLVRETTTDGSIGEPVMLIDRYTNLQPRKIQGVDFGVNYTMDTDIGNFKLKWDAAYIKYFFQSSNEDMQLIEAADRELQNVGSLIKENGRPRWRSSASLNWRYENWGAGLYSKFVGDVEDSSVTADSDTEAPGTRLPVPSFTTLSANVSYSFEDNSSLTNGMRIQVGLRNIFDRDPPIADEGYGYFGSLHSNRGQYAYLNVSKKF